MKKHNVKQSLLTLFVLVIIGFVGIQYYLDSKPTAQVVSQESTTQRGEGANPDMQGLTETKESPLRYPHIVNDSTLANFQDATNESGIPIRVYKSGLTVTYKSYLPKKPDVVTELADRNAFLCSLYEQDMGSSEFWKTMRVHVGMFTQDGCLGAADVVVYEFQNDTVAMIDVNGSDSVLEGSSCNDEISKEPIHNVLISDEYGNRVQSLENCLKAHFSKPENQKKLLTYFDYLKNLHVE